MTSIQDSTPREKQISQSFSYCELTNLLRNGTIVCCLWENKKTSEKSVFRVAWSPELTSQSFPDPCFRPRGIVPHWKWNLMLLVHQNTGKENRYGKNFFLLYLSVHWGDLIKQRKKICHIHFKSTVKPNHMTIMELLSPNMYVLKCTTETFLTSFFPQGVM